MPEAKPPASTQPSRRLGAIFAAVYLAFVAGLGGWLADRLWQPQHVALIMMPPGMFALVVCWPAAHLAARNQMYSVALLYLVAAPLLAVATFGGVAVLLAGLVAQTVGDWNHRVARALLPAITALLLGGGAAWATRRRPPPV